MLTTAILTAAGYGDRPIVTSRRLPWCGRHEVRAVPAHIREWAGGEGPRDVVAHAGAPRGSLQYYFPGGKRQLVDEAVDWAGRYASGRVGRFMAAMTQPAPSALFAAMAAQWTDEFLARGFGAGCPVAAAIVDCAKSAESTRAAAAAALAGWRRSVALALTELGAPAKKAGPLATVMVSALEGAILIARSEQDVAALQTVVEELGPLLDGYAA